MNNGRPRGRARGRARGLKTEDNPTIGQLGLEAEARPNPGQGRSLQAEAPPTPGLDRGLQAETPPTPGLGRGLQAEAPPTPGLGRGLQAEAPPTPGLGRGLQAEAPPTPGLGRGLQAEAPPTTGLGRGLLAEAPPTTGQQEDFPALESSSTDGRSWSVRNPVTNNSPGFVAWGSQSHQKSVIGRGAKAAANQILEVGGCNEQELPKDWGGARPKTNLVGNLPVVPPTDEMSLLSLASGCVTSGTPTNGSAPVLSVGRGRSRGRGGTPTVGASQGEGHLLPPSGPLRDGEGPQGGVHENGGRGRGFGQRRPRYADMNLPHAPGCGISGRSVQLFSNHFRPQTVKDFIIYQYHVEFSPYIQSKFLRTAMMREQKLFGKFFIFDGVALFSSIRLPTEVTKVFGKRHSDNEKISIEVRCIREILPGTPDCSFIWNNVLKRLLHMLGLKEIGRDYFSPELAQQVPEHKLEIWPGYSTAILDYDIGLMLNVDICHKYLNLRTVFNMIEDIEQNSLNAQFHSKVERELIGNSVLTRYNNRMYQVIDIDWKNNPSSNFTTHRGEEMTYIQYFVTHHEIKIDNLEQPLLVAKVKDREGKYRTICLIPELCLLTGIPSKMNSDSFLRRRLMKETCLTPTARAQRLTALVGSLHHEEETRQQMEAWGMNLNAGLNTLNSRQLLNEQIVYGNTKTICGSAAIFGPDFSNGYKNGSTVCASMPMQNWLLVYPAKYQKEASTLMSNFRFLASRMGITLNEPEQAQIASDKIGDYLAKLRASIHLNGLTSLVVVILGTNHPEKYQEIKRLCCTDYPVPSQMVLASTLQNQRRVASVCTNIVVQINCKLGGVPWSVKIPSNGLMVVGIDTYHDTRSRERSAAGFVASYDQTLTRYYSKCNFVTAGCDMHDHLETCMKSALRYYHLVNRSLPDRIIVYRDGVGDGQIAQSGEYEVPQMKRGIKFIYDSDDRQMPKFAFIIVKKRISTRLFLKRGNYYDNPAAGTVVDTVITNPLFYDFFLVPQTVRQGCVSPCHYIVVSDSTGWSPDFIQRLTYKLTHLYFNWQGTIRVPAPVMYAHKIAYLHGVHLHRVSHPSLDDKLYYL